MEKNNLGDHFFHFVNDYLHENGIKVSRGTIVDASIISAPSSTKNKDKKRDPEMHQTRKGNQWYFGMKAHIGVDSKTKLIHSVAVTLPMQARAESLRKELRMPEILLRKRKAVIAS